MAGQKETPRQKMIGLMYLVLMAMLALNVSKDILDSFVQVDKSLTTSIKNTELKTEQLYAEFEMSKQYDPIRVTAAYDQAHLAKGKSMEMILYIDQLKKRLMTETDGLEESVGDTLQLENVLAKDNFDISTHIMIGLSDDGSAGVSFELKNKIESFRTELIGLLPGNDQQEANIGLILEGGVEDGRKLNWEMNTFYHTTLAATIVHLTKLQNDIKNAELDIVNKLYAAVAKVDIAFDTVAPKVVAPTSYVLLGEEYNADVFLAAFNKTKNPKISINGEAIPVKSGLGQYKLKTSREGAFTYNGIIQVETNSGEIKKFPFESNYIVARPSLTVSPTKMNVLYIGLTNPVSVSVPGVASGNVAVSISGSGNRITKSGSGSYDVKLAKNCPKTINISV
ncbi:MAG: gliding motility protein GldM, partial [Flavobacteriales bacterium]|nr:gliding motility protein GldM [Flavobacteriales bacterium]